MTVTETSTTPCGSCSTPVSDDELHQVGATEMCESCAGEYSECDNCQAVNHMDYVVYDENTGSYYCETCADLREICIECDAACSTPRGYGDYHTLPSGDVVCGGCYYDSYSTCDECENVCHSSQMVGDTCEDCEESNDIADWNYKPAPVFFGLPPRVALPTRGQMTYGVELETEYREFPDRAAVNDAARCLWTDRDATYLKGDGSLEDGVEIVSHPMTLEFARANINREAIQEMVSLGQRAWNTGRCGIHIHLGRVGFQSKAHMARFAILYYRSQAQLQGTAGRDSARWATFDMGSQSVVKQSFGKEQPLTRYRALNFENRTTIEARIFRGSINADTIIAHIEMLDAMVAYTGDLAMSGSISSKLTWAPFRQYLHTHTDNWPQAEARLVARVDGRHN